MISSNENQTHTQWLIDENSINFWQKFLNIINATEPSQNPKIQTLKEYSKNKNLPLTINQGGGNFLHNSILSGNADNEQLLDTIPQNIVRQMPSNSKKRSSSVIELQNSEPEPSKKKTVPSKSTRAWHGRTLPQNITSSSVNNSQEIGKNLHAQNPLYCIQQF